MFKFLHHSNGSADFAVFPEVSHRLRDFARAPVRLQLGDGRWGFKHIELAHAKEIARLNLSTIAYVGSIVKPGAPIYCEFESVGKSQRTQTVNVRIGTVVLEYKTTRDDNFYTIITAFSRRQPLGELIGALE